MDTGRGPDGLSEPEVLSDEEAFGFLADIDAREEAKRRRRGPDALQLSAQFQAASGEASGNSSTDPVPPSGNGKAGRQERGADGATKNRRPGRLTRDAGDAAARVLSRRPFAVRWKKGAGPGTSPAVAPRQPEESAPATVEGVSAGGGSGKESEPESAVGCQSEAEAVSKVESEAAVAPKPSPRDPWSAPAGRWAARAPRYHAQGSLAESRGGGRRIVAVALLLAALAAAGSWWLFRAQGHPQSRYLPRRSELFLSMNWPALTKSRFFQMAKDTPGLRLVERVRVFAQNAGLGYRDIERVTAGGTADGGNLIVVYRLTRPIPPEKIVGRPSFRALRKTDGPSETVRGVPVYYVGPSALAFPEPQVIVNGDLELVRQVLRARSAGIAGPLEELLETADFSTTCLEMSVGVPLPLRDSFLQAYADQADTVAATATNYTYGSIVKFRRTLQVRDAEAVEGLRTSAEQSIRTAAKDERCDEKLRGLLKEVHVSKSAQAVHIELELLPDAVPPETVKQLRQLF